MELYFVSFAAVSVTDAAVCGKFEGIADKVGHHLENTVLVSLDDNILVRSLVDQFYSHRTTEFQRVVYLVAEQM